MVNNETAWDCAVKVRDAINKLINVIDQQNRILQRILEVLSAK